MSKIYRVDDKVYGVSIFLCIGTLEEYKAFLLRKFNVELKTNISAGKYHALEHSSTGCQAHAIWMPEYDDCIPDNTTLSHECLHAAIGTLSFHGVGFSKDNDEALTYLHAFYYSQFLNKLNKKRRAVE